MLVSLRAVRGNKGFSFFSKLLKKEYELNPSDFCQSLP